MYLFAKPRRSLFLQIILLVVLSCDYILSYSQMPQWDWAVQVHGNQNDPLDFFDADNFGNVLIVGEIYSTAIIIGDTQLIRKFDYIGGEVYFAVLNKEGDLNWARSIYAMENDYVQAIDIRSAVFDSYGNVLIAGWYPGGNIYIDSTTLFGGDKNSLGFVLKFDKQGNLLWSHLYEDGVNSKDLVCDQKGGFYYLGHMNSDCLEMDLGDIILENNSDQDQAFIAHYNNENIADWAKLIIGSVDGFQGISNEKGDLCFWGEFQSISLNIDSITLINTQLYNYQDYFGIINSSGTTICARTASNDPHGFYSLIFNKDSIFVIGAFSGNSIIIEQDTLFELPDGFETKFLSIFNYDGEYKTTHLFSSDFNFTYLFNISAGKNNELVIGSVISSTYWNGIDTLINLSGSADPAVKYLDTDLNKIGGFSLPMIDDNSIPITMTDPFGNMLFVSSIESDTLIFGDDTIKNYQLQTQRDFYIAKSSECDNSLFDISIVNGSLHALNGIEWQWYANDTLIKYGTSQNYYPSYKAFYRARVSLENGCIAWSKPFDYFVTGNTNDLDEINIMVYPNPANNLVNIVINEPFDKLAIYNTTGQKIASWMGADQLNTTFSHHSPGFYFVYVTKNEIQTCIKIILQ